MLQAVEISDGRQRARCSANWLSPAQVVQLAGAAGSGAEVQERLDAWVRDVTGRGSAG